MQGNSNNYPPISIAFGWMSLMPPLPAWKVFANSRSGINLQCALYANQLNFAQIFADSLPPEMTSLKRIRQ
jgi:hypothetical protein